MGRNLLRRKTICQYGDKLIRSFFLAFILLFPAGTAFPERLPVDPMQAELQSLLTPDKNRTNSYLTPEQGHMGLQVYTFPVTATGQINFYHQKYTEGNGREWLARVLQRGDLYRDYIIRRLEEYQVPRELLFLPVIESAYSGNAVSRSGAVGLWQFMLNSIAPYDITIDKWVDDRRDFWKATEASIKKLIYNHSVLDDWLLALAAYNCGLGKITRTIEKTGIRDFWTLAEKGHLPYETAHYIPKFLAIAGICSYPGRYGFALQWEEPFLWEKIALDQAVDLRILAREAGIPYEVLVQGNLELRYRVSPPGDHNYFLKVPAVFSDVVRETLERKDHKLMKFHIYEICSGDTLYDLSLHYGISVDMIKEYNSGINPRALRIGQRILVPLLKDIAAYQGKKQAGSGRTASSGLPFTGTYTVQQGDTLWAIARRHGISPEELADKNLLTLDTVIHGGLVLKVPGNETSVR